MSSLEDDLLEALNAEGYDVKDVRPRGVLPDGTEVRGVIREAGEFVKQLLVFSGNELDEETAKSLLRYVFAWLRTREDSGDVYYVSIFGADNRSVLSTVAVPRPPLIAGPHDPQSD